MAETRKHRPRTSFIGDQVRASIDPGPRPTEPGEYFDPFVDESVEAASAVDQPEVIGFGVSIDAASDAGTSDWYSLDADALRQLLDPHDTGSSSADDDDESNDEEL